MIYCIDAKDVPSDTRVTLVVKIDEKDRDKLARIILDTADKGAEVEVIKCDDGDYTNRALSITIDNVEQKLARLWEEWS